MIKTIEGFGLPGSGKSTCIKKVKVLNVSPSLNILIRHSGETKILDKIRFYSNEKLNIVCKNFIIILYLIVRPRYFFSVLNTLVLFKFNRSFISVLLNLIEAQYCYSKFPINKTNNKILLLDEGLVQYLGSLAVNVPEFTQIPNQIIEHTLKNYIKELIYFEINIQNTIDRIIIRNDGKSRFDTMSQEDKIINLKRMEKVFVQCLEVAKKLEIPVLKINAENSIDYNTNLIINHFST